MAELRGLLAALGLENGRSLLQSGNLAFRSDVRPARSWSCWNRQWRNVLASRRTYRGSRLESSSPTTRFTGSRGAIGIFWSCFEDDSVRERTSRLFRRPSPGRTHSVKAHTRMIYPTASAARVSQTPDQNSGRVEPAHGTYILQTRRSHERRRHARVTVQFRPAPQADCSEPWRGDKGCLAAGGRPLLLRATRSSISGNSTW